ncbi:MAG: TrkH family potassium uptake protein [Ruminococcaceae bacterium]|nr:TrkH family potassium uptake protein [Oscillospiraceae bacterium]
MNYRMIKYITGWLLIFEALFMAVPAITAAVYHEPEFWHFLMVMGGCVLLGGLMVLRKPASTTLYAKEGFIIVSLSWIILSLVGALPFFISGSIPNYVDALFETASGFTTTGASILTAVEPLPKCMLMWRSFTHWVGGMGVLVFIMAFVPLSGGHNLHIMKAESPGPSVSKLVPRVKTTALILYSIYLSLTFIEFVMLLMGGVSVFESLTTAFGTAGTGGFGVLNDSIASYSPYVQIVVTVFMLLFSVNFSCYYLFLLGRLKDAFNAELRSFLLIVAAAIGIITANISHMYSSLGESLRHSAFAVSSIISTTGFATEDFNLWPALSKTILVLIMFVGACAGSTGGGIKVSRIIIFIKGVGRELGSMIHPHRVKKVTVDKRPLDDDTVRSVNVYMVCFLLVFVSSIALISIEGHDLVTNFTAVTATINNIGPGLELVGPTQNFAFFSYPSKLVLIFDMLAGRLELFPMLLLFNPKTWRK